MNYISDLILVRGVSGAGKSSVADCIAAGRDQWHKVPVFSTDDYFMKREWCTICDDGEPDDEICNENHNKYVFDPSKLPEYHKLCQVDVEEAMEDWNINTIVVANTFTEEWQMKPYFELAKKHDYNVHTIIVENRHGSKSVHNVPDHALARQKEALAKEIVL